MSPEEIRNQCEDDADRAPSDLTVWRDRGAIIAAQQTRIAQLEAQIARVRVLADGWALNDCPCECCREGLDETAVRAALGEATT